jgi:hypothetical protein
MRGRRSKDLLLLCDYESILEAKLIAMDVCKIAIIAKGKRQEAENAITKLREDRQAESEIGEKHNKRFWDELGKLSRDVQYWEE